MQIYRRRMLHLLRFVYGNSGQVLLIVILTMIVALTVGLAIASRTVTNIRISKENEESQRSFQAAEAGVEQKLKNPTQTLVDISLPNQAKFTANIAAPQNASEILLNGGSEVDQDVGIDVWLSDYPGFINKRSGSITINWVQETQTSCSGVGSAVRPAIEILLLSGADVNNPTFSKSVFEPSTCTRIPGASSAGAGSTIEGEVFSSSATISFTNGIIMKVIPIFNSAKIGVSASITAPAGFLFLPSQGKEIESTGKSGETVRRIRYFNSNPQIPTELFQYAIMGQN